MKKKVLTTAMALAMLAPTASAFASTITTSPVTGADSVAHNSELTIEGTVLNSSGQAPEGQLNVTLPTKVGFSVDTTGSFIPAQGMVITNNSACPIDVSVSKFVDPTSTTGEGITVVSATQIVGNESDYDRSFVSLSLRANGGTNGSVVELLNGMSETKLVTVDASGTSSLDLLGNAGTGEYNAATHKNNDTDFDTKGANDNFTLTFKIAKNK